MSGNGLDKVVEDAKYYMRRYGVSPNLLIIPPQLALYMSLAPEEKISYKEGGPTALANFEAGAAGFTTRAFRGCGVVTSDPFEVSDDTEAVQMLQRFSQVGEHYIMSVTDANKGSGDIVIYDEERDVHVKISLKQAIKATGLFTVDDNLKVTPTSEASKFWPPPAAGSTPKKFQDNMTIDEYIAELDKALQGEVSSAAIILARPFIEHAMLSAVLTVSGQDTGATIFGPSDMQISANTSVKTIEGARRPPRDARPRATVARLARTLRAPRRPLHGPLQVGHHEAAERVRPPRHHGQRLPRGLQHRVLRQKRRF